MSLNNLLRPRNMIIIGFIFSLTGVILPLLMVIQVLPSTYFLNFFSYTISLIGLFMGIIGAASYIRTHRRKK